MELAQPWVLFVLAGALTLAVAVVLVLRRLRRLRRQGLVPVAHTELLTDMPEYRRSLRRRGIFAWTGLLVLLGVTVVAMVGVARPIDVDVRKRDMVNRDIMLCLDVSGSMMSVDGAILQRFAEISARFQGERIGLVVWNSTPARAFPLTDDYAYIDETLRYLGDGAEQYASPVPMESSDVWDLLAGTFSESRGTSLIGDGLGACVYSFDHEDTERSRTIILATDNQVYGDELITLPEAAELAALRKVRVYSLYPERATSAAEAEQLKMISRATGGEAYGLQDASAVDRIVATVLSDQAASLPGKAELVETDNPRGLMIPALLGTWAVLLLLWRARQ